MGDYADDAMDREMGDRWAMPYTPYRLMRLAKKDITCNHCGVPAYWQETVDKDGHPRIKLFAGGKPHDCRQKAASPDDFTDVTGADLG